MPSIQTNIAANAAYRSLTSTGINLQKSIEKLSSGFRINRAGDDAAGLSIANSLRSEGRAVAVGQRNATAAAAILDIADGAVNQLTTIVDRMRELAATSVSDNTGTTDRTALQAEFATLQAELNRTVGDTTYQGTALIDGTFAGKNFRVGTTAGQDTVSLTIATTNASALGLDAAAVSIGTVTAASSALASIVATSNSVLATVIGQIGAAQNRVMYAQSVLSSRAQNIAAAESVIRDVDVAKETSQFTKYQILQQAGTAMLAQANQSPQTVLSLLR